MRIRSLQRVKIMSKRAGKRTSKTEILKMEERDCSAVSATIVDGEKRMKRSLDALASSDTKIADAIRKVGYPHYSACMRDGDMMDLIKSVVSQQISVAGARTIMEKVEGWLLRDELPPAKKGKSAGKGGSSSVVLDTQTEVLDASKRRKLEYGVFSTGKPLKRTTLQVCDKILATTDTEFTLISLGNGNKRKAVISLAEHLKAGKLDFPELENLSNAEVAKKITQVYGLGPWSADMYLMFTLGRDDVWPAGDDAMVRGLALIYGKNLEGMKSAARAKWAVEKGKEFPPEHLSSLARLCYRFVDANKPPKK